MLSVKISPIFILTAVLLRPDSGKAVDLHQELFLSSRAGENVTISCTFDETQVSERKVWYKQKPGGAPQPMGTALGASSSFVLAEFQKSGIKLETTSTSFSLFIPHATKHDEGLYFCGMSQGNIIVFYSVTFLSVTDDQEVNISVVQSPERGSVSPGEEVTLQCSVFSQIKAAELTVLWVRAAAGQSFPQIISTGHSSSSRPQSEIRSSSHSCVSNFTKNITHRSNRAATYYCAVEVCARVIFEKMTAVEVGRADETPVPHNERTMDLHQEQFLSSRAGENVIIQCTFDETLVSERKVWYKQKPGRGPQPMGTALGASSSFVLPKFQNSGIKLETNSTCFSLFIPHTTKDDEGLYFCGKTQGNIIVFYSVTFLSVTDDQEVNISVVQSPERGSVSPGEEVTLQCSVFSQIKAAELTVLWVRAAAGQSFPQIISTGHSSSSRPQSEIRSSSHSCVSNFTKNITHRSNHAATYYCAVEVCGRVVFGNGTVVERAEPVDVVMILVAALGVCVVVIFTQAFFIHKRSSRVRLQPGSMCGQEMLYTVEQLIKERHSGHRVYSEVRYFTVTDHHPKH